MDKVFEEGKMLILLTGTLLLCSFCTFFLVPQQGIIKRVMHPLGLFILFFSTIHFFIPFLQSIFQIGRFNYFSDDGDGSYIVFSSLICCGYLFIVISTFYFCKAPAMNFPMLSLVTRFTKVTANERKTLNLCMFFTLVGILIILKIVLAYRHDYASFMANRINLLSGYAYLLKLIMFSIPLAILLACRNMAKGKYFISSQLVVLIIMVFIANVLIGSRAQALILIVFLFATFMYINTAQLKSRDILKIFLSLIIIFLFAISLGHLRTAIKLGGLSNVNIQQSPTSAPPLIKELYTSFGHTELLAFTLENGERYDFAYGKTYLAGFLSFFPRVLWKEKPLGGGPMLVNIIAPGSYVLGQKKANSSLTTGVVIEAFLNLGLVGVLFIALLHGWLLSMVTKSSNYIKSRVDFTLFLILLHFSALLIVNAEFLGAFSGFAFIYLPILFMRKVKI